MSKKKKKKIACKNLLSGSESNLIIIVYLISMYLLTPSSLINLMHQAELKIDTCWLTLVHTWIIYRNKRQRNSHSGGMNTHSLTRTKKHLNKQKYTYIYIYRKWTQVPTLDEADSISHSTNTLGKGLILVILPL